MGAQEANNDVPYRQFGWLFGLEADKEITINTNVLSVRRMAPDEAAYIRDQSAHFLVNPSLWVNSINRFPYVYERRAVGKSLSIGDPRFAAVLSLLAEGEIQTPVSWALAETSTFQMGASSSSEVIELMFRLMNGRLHTVPISSIENSACHVIPMLQSFFARQWNDIVGLDQVVIERVFIAKRHKIDGADLAGLVNRATEICSALEYLFSEGSTSEIAFRLGMSLAWLLERTPAKREKVIADMKEAYNLRSRRVHGVRITEKVAEAVAEVRAVDLLLRRAIMARILSEFDDKAWLALFKATRIGTVVEGFDRVEWLAN
jgi:hypothetical protein